MMQTNGDGGCDPALDASAAAPMNATQGFMAECTMNEQCTSGLCFTFNMKGPHCSAPCNEGCQCPAPSTGCSGMGVCKAP